MKHLLLITLLLWGGTAYSQVFKAIEYRSSDTSSWTYSRDTIKIDNYAIHINGSPYRILQYDQVKDGAFYYTRYYCTDPKGLKCSISLANSESSITLYIEYPSVKTEYKLTKKQ